MVDMLFNVNPQKFKDVAKDKNFNEFKEYFLSLNNFNVCQRFTESDWEHLYALSRAK